MKQRLAYIDGLRGVAVLLVLFHHVWMPRPPQRLIFVQTDGRLEVAHLTSPLDWIAGRGYLGVSLFLVISGFCLAYPPLRRRAEGRADWFSARTFFARRCVRILPPYYVALALCLGLWGTLALLGWARPSIWSGSLSLPNLGAHLLLVHNLIPHWSTTIDAPFWTLGLEWQWYLVFPLVLFCCARWPARTGLFCLVLAAIWCYFSGDVLAHASWLPGRLFEFCCGVLCAAIVVHARVPSARGLLPGAVLVALLAEIPRFPGWYALYQPMYGIVFALILLAAHRGGPLTRALSVRPLAGIGLISYSLYLVHYPVVLWLEEQSPMWLRGSYAMPLVAAVAAIAVACGFYWAVERHFMRPEVALKRYGLSERLGIEQRPSQETQRAEELQRMAAP